MGGSLAVVPALGEQNSLLPPEMLCKWPLMLVQTRYYDRVFNTKCPRVSGTLSKISRGANVGVG